MSLMKARFHTFTGRHQLPGLILIWFYCNPGFKNLFNKTYTATLLNYGWSMVFRNQQAANEANNLILIMPANISETKKYFLKTSLCL
jgi:hypothetical protein